MFSSEEHGPEGVSWGARGETGSGGASPSEDPFGDFQSLLFHARQRRAGHGLGPHRPGQAALLQHEVVVGSRVHGVENVGVVRDTQLCGPNKKKQKKKKKSVKNTYYMFFSEGYWCGVFFPFCLILDIVWKWWSAFPKNKIKLFAEKHSSERDSSPKNFLSTFYSSPVCQWRIWWHYQHTLRTVATYSNVKRHNKQLLCQQTSTLCL